jgi:predicted KAP-like P-loop ATPase
VEAADGAAPAPESSHPFSADRPIGSNDEDLLGRAPFAENLAKAIEGWRGKDSLVIALYGPWGVGKTSLKNLVVEELNGKVAVVEFNPWQWSGQDRIAQAFFEHLARGIARTAHGLRARWRARWAAIRVRDYARLLDVAVAGLGLAGRIGAPLAALVSREAGRGLERAKARLAALLRRLDRPVLVVMDDVDRLTADEIRLVFQLVKANADFPNLVYLLLFDRGVIEAALETPGVSGREFLEKIIQVGFDVPHPERSRIDRVLFRQLDELLALPGMADRWDQQRWARLFLDGVRPLLQTLRDVHRFSGMLSFQVSLLRQHDTLEVNPIDLVGLELLRVFEPEVHRALLGAKDALTQVAPGLAGSAFGSRDAELDARRTQIRSLAESARPEDRAAVEGILKELFPTARWAFGEPAYARMEEAWLRDLRVCRPEIFDRYFLLAVPEADISQVELEELIAVAGDRAAFAQRLRGLQERGLIEVVLDRLSAYLERLDLTHAVPFVTALFDVGDGLPGEVAGLFGLSPLDRAHLLLRWFLERQPDKAARADLLRQAFRATQGLSLPVLVVAGMRGEIEEPGPDQAVLGEEDLRDLEGLCLEMIRAAARDGRLVRPPLLVAFLHQWERWAPGEPKQWVEGLIHTPDGVLAFLRGSLSRVVSQSAGQYLPEERHVVPLKEIEPFVSVEELSSAVEGLAEDQLRPEDRQAVVAFRRAVRRRAEGKPGR